jgi:hypothetical protein
MDHLMERQLKELEGSNLIHQEQYHEEPDQTGLESHTPKDKRRLKINIIGIYHSLNQCYLSD